MHTSGVGPASATTHWAVRRVLKGFPETGLDLATDGRLIDLVTGRFDAEIRFSERRPRLTATTQATVGIISRRAHAERVLRA